VADVLGLGKAMEYVRNIGYDNIKNYEDSLTNYALAELQSISPLRLIGQAKQRSGVISFLIEGCHHADMGTILDQMGIAIRTGHHCAQPVMQHFRIDGTCRISLSFYNSFEEIDALIQGLKISLTMLK